MLATLSRQTTRTLMGSSYPEGGAIRSPDGQVGEDSEQAIGQGRPEGEVVRDLVDGQEEVLVRRCPKDVGDRPELPRPE